MKLFLDCGTNLGQGLNYFNNKFKLFNNSEWDIYTFEPNPHIPLDSMFNYVKNLYKINKAIWISETPIRFICKGKKEESVRKQYNEDRFQGGGSQLDIINKNSIPSHIETDYISVECIDFSNFLKSKSDNYEEIIVKMDIEGAEFQIIDYLIEKDTLRLIDELFIETHGRFEFQEKEWTSKKNEIQNIENTLLEKCRKHITHVHFWS